MRKQKILYVLTKGNWGGAQRYVFDLACNLSKDQFDARIIVGEGEDLPQRLEAKDIPVTVISSLGRDLNFWADLKSFFSLILLLRRERPDIVHLNSSKIGGLGALAARIVRVPKIIFTAHGWPFKEERSFFQKFLIKLASWLTIVLAHRAIVISESEHQAVIKWPLTKNKLVKIYNGIASQNFVYRDTARETLIEQNPNLEPHRHQIWIGSIGELHRNKGFDLAIKLMAKLKEKLPGARLIIIGKGEEQTNLEKQIKALNLGDRVFLVGEIKDAAQILKAFDIFLLPSRKEGLPYVILEAGQAGLPVVASKVGGIPEILKTERAGILINPHKIEEVVDRLVYLGSNNLEREILGHSLEQIIRRDFPLPDMAQKTILLYNK